MTSNEREQENSRKGKTNYLDKKNSQTLRREANETVTYESSVGLNLGASKDKPDSRIELDVPAEFLRLSLKSMNKQYHPTQKQNAWEGWLSCANCR